MNKIIIKDLRVVSNIGLGEDERATPQSLSIDLKLYPSINIEECDDDIDKTINYFDICNKVREITSVNKQKLIESLASDIGDNLLKNYDLKQVNITLKKYIIPDTRYIGVKMKFLK